MTVNFTTLSLDMAINAANASAQRNEKERAALLREDGRPVFSEREHADRMATLAQSDSEALASVKAERDKLTADWAARESELKARMAAEAGDVAGWFEGSERSELGDRLPIVAAQIDGLGDDALIEQLEAVAAAGSPLERATWWLAAGRRLREAREAAESDQPNDAEAAMNTGRIPFRSGSGSPSLGRLGDAMRRLREAAMPATVAKKIAEIEADLAAFGPARVDMYGKKADLEINRQKAEAKRRVSGIF